MKKVVAVVFLAMCLAYAFQMTAKADEKKYHTTPDDFPTWNVTGQRADYLFISHFKFIQCADGAISPSYLLLLDGKGELVYYRAVEDCRAILDFKPQPDGTLSYWLGATSNFDGTFYRMNNQYTIFAEYGKSDGILVDPHEFLVLENGNALFIGLKRVAVSSATGTIPNVSEVDGIVIREVSPEGTVVFQWNSWEHYAIDDAQDIYSTSSDYAHSNAIEVDTDGNLLLSTRHFNEITKIDRKTGEILWRMGGKRNQFTLLNADRWFSHQHDVRRLANGHISLFDNGNFLAPAYSRYIEYAVDESALTLTKVREIRHSPDIYSFAMGSARAFANGNVLIGWGSTNDPAVTEYNAQGKAIFELALPNGEFSYRAYSGNWTGNPQEPLTIKESDGILYYSWNGSTETKGYRIYGDNKLLATQIKDGFENEFLLDTDHCTYRIVAVGKHGNSLQETAYRAEACQFTFLPVVGNR